MKNQNKQNQSAQLIIGGGLMLFLGIVIPTDMSIWIMIFGLAAFIYGIISYPSDDDNDKGDKLMVTPLI